MFVAKHSGLYIFINKSLQLLLHLNLGECLDDVAHLNVVVVDERDTALQTCNDLLHVVLVTLQGGDSCGVDHDSVAHDMGLVL